MREFECREAAVYTHTSWSEWSALDSHDKALSIAHYRLQLLIKAHVEEASYEASRKAQARAKSKARTN